MHGTGFILAECSFVRGIAEGLPRHRVHRERYAVCRRPSARVDVAARRPSARVDVAARLQPKLADGGMANESRTQGRTGRTWRYSVNVLESLFHIARFSDCISKCGGRAGKTWRDAILGSKSRCCFVNVLESLIHTPEMKGCACR